VIVNMANMANYNMASPNTTKPMMMRPVQLMAPCHKLVVVMVGLPARGKSYMAKKIYKYLRHLNLITKLFNLGSYRRVATKDTTVGKASASFFDPDNEEAVKIRRQCCLDGMADLVSWFNTGGQVGILDATNTTLERRNMIRQFFKTKVSELEYDVSLLYVESICNDESIVQNNIITVKLKNPDYCTVDAQKAINDFNERIANYQKKYVQVGKDEGSYIKVINVGIEVNGYMIDDYISCRIFYFLMHLHLHSQNKRPQKPLLMQLQKSIKSSQEDQALEERLKKISASIGTKFQRPAFDQPDYALGPWMRRQSYLMWTDAEDTYKEEKEKENKDTKDKTPAKAKGVPGMQRFPSIPDTTEVAVATTSISSQPMSPDTPSMTMIGSPRTAVPRRRPRVHRASTLFSVITRRRTLSNVETSDTEDKARSSRPNLADLVIEEDALNTPTTPKPATSTQTAQSGAANTGYASDNEEESDAEPLQQANGLKKRKSLKIKSSSKFLERKANGNEPEDTPDLHTEDEEENDDEFACELCGRTVPKSQTTLVDSTSSSGDKVRICEVCLYESDSEEETTPDAHTGAYMEPMYTVPGSATQTPSTKLFANENGSFNNEYLDVNALAAKTKAMSKSIHRLVQTMGDDSSVTQELMKLQKDMDGLFSD